MTDFEKEFEEEIVGPRSKEHGVTIENFRAYMPAHTYIFMPCCEIWSGASLNSRLPKVPVLKKNGQPKLDSQGRPLKMTPTTWLDRNRPVEQISWCPGLPTLIEGRLVVDGGWIERGGVAVFNLYRPPRIKSGDGSKAGPWIEHAHRIYPADADHIIAWLAQRVQRPQDKINHALVLGGAQGIGKDTLLEPVKHAVGPWNYHEVSPSHLLGRFNAFAKSVILRVNEAHDLGDVERVNRFNFYERSKIYTCNPPDVLRVDEKHLREHYVFNCLGFLITTNHKTDGVYLPPDDRRHYVAWSDLTKEDFPQAYWNGLWGWYNKADGFKHVAAYLGELDISKFDSKAPPEKTPAFWEIVFANQAPEDAELADVIDKLNSPDALTTKQLIAEADGPIAQWLMDRKNRRAIPHRLSSSDYEPIRNSTKDGLWVVDGARQVIYAKTSLPAQEKYAAARRLQERMAAAAK